LFHDLGKPAAAWRGADGRLHYYARAGHSERSHEQVGCELAQSALSRLRYPNALRSLVLRIVRHHMFQVGTGDAARARRFLAKYGDALASEPVDHREPDFAGKPGPGDEPPVGDIERVQRFREQLRREQRQPHRLSDLAVDGTDLIAAGYEPGPALGRALRELLHEVVEDPSRNTKAALLSSARAKLERA